MPFESERKHPVKKPSDKSDGLHQQDNQNRPVMLNRFIVVTVFTILVALGYLGNYYFGQNTGREVMWYSPPLKCSALHQQCVAYVGVHEGIGLRLHDEGNGRLTAEASSFHLNNPHYEFRLISLNSGPPRNIDAITMTSDHSASINTPSLECALPDARWRVELRVKSGERSMGTWSDFRLPCQSK